MRCYSVTVAILMSTYNGAKYLEEQIQSIINQSYPDWHLYIRDDGSTDDTPKIINKYAEKDTRITFFNQDNIKNIGINRSFLQLLSETSADLYMFSDQDDVWQKNKVSLSVKAMKEKNNANQPACVFTELQVVDKELIPLRLMNNGNIWFDFPHFLFGNCVTGCTMMINQQLKTKLKLDLTNIDKIYLHDWWIALITSAIGKLIYIKEPTILYRQHGDNVEGSKKNNLFTLSSRALHLQSEEKAMLKMFLMDQEFQKLFAKQVTGVNKQYLDGYVKLLGNCSFINRLKLIITLPPKRLHLKGRLLFSYMILCKYRGFSHLQLNHM